MMAGMLKLFLVEDSSLISDRMVHMLEQINGVEVIATASHLSQARELLLLVQPDLLVLDLQLPDGNALQALDSLQALAPLAQMAVFSNHFGPAIRARCAQAGLRWVFDKSCEFELLLALVHRLSAEQLGRAAA